MATGYPTPDNFDGDADFICIPIVVPNKTEFKAAIYGLYAQMSKEYFWRNFGTMTAQQAAWLSSRGLALTDAYGECGDVMACEDVADCFESEIVTNQTLINAFTEAINNAGYGNPNRVNATVTKIADRNVAGKMAEDIKELSDCNLDKLWGGLRHGIVARLDESLADTLQDIAAIPTIIGRNAAWLDIIPVIGDIAEAIVTSLSSVTPTLLSLYEAHSSEATLDEIACDLFGIVCSECRYPTHQEIYDYFKNFALPATPSIGDWVLETMTQLLTNPVGVTAKVAYFTLMCWQLGILYLQATFNGSNGTEALYNYATLGEDFASDNWLQLCDACGEQYMEYAWDFTQAQWDSYRTDGFSGNISSGNYVAGKGWRLSSINATDGLMQVGLALDPAWQIVAVAYKSSAAAGAQVAAFRTTPSASGGQTVNLNAADTPYTQRANMILNPQTNRNEFALRLAATLASNLYLEKIAMRFNAGFAPLGSTPVASPNFAP